MRVEVELLNAEGSWYLTLLVDLGAVEHLLLRVVLEDVARLCVLEITPRIRPLTGLVHMMTFAILKDDNVASLVSVELTQDVAHVEGSIVRVRWHLHRMKHLSKVLDHLLRHHDLSLKGLILLFQLLLAKDIPLTGWFRGRRGTSRHLSAMLDPPGLGLQPGSLFLRCLALLFCFEVLTLLPQRLLPL